MLIPSVRKIHNTNSAKVIGRFFSRKMGSHLPFESTMERDWLLWLEYRRDIVRFACQPMTFRYAVDGQDRRYTPDMLGELAGDAGAVCYEVKPAKQLESPSLQAKLWTCGLAVEKKGYRFEVVTEQEIRVEPQLTNLKRLGAYVRGEHLTGSERAALHRVMRQRGSASIQTVCKLLADECPHVGLAALYREIFCGDLEVDISQVVTPLSHVTLREVNHGA